MIKQFEISVSRSQSFRSGVTEKGIQAGPEQRHKFTRLPSNQEEGSTEASECEGTCCAILSEKNSSKQALNEMWCMKSANEVSCQDIYTILSCACGGLTKSSYAAFCKLYLSDFAAKFQRFTIPVGLSTALRPHFEFMLGRPFNKKVNSICSIQTCFVIYETIFTWLL